MNNPSPDEIKAARAASGLSQTAAAQLIHCSRSTWAEWEGGVSRMHPAFWELFKLKAKLNLPKKTPNNRGFLISIPAQRGLDYG